MEDLRTVVLLNEDLLEDVEINFNDIKKCDIFRLYEYGVAIEHAGSSILYAIEDAKDGKIFCDSYSKILEEEFINLLN